MDTMESSAHAASGAGLTMAEAQKRLRIYGPNRLRDQPRRRALVDLAMRFRNPLVLTLLSAAAISGLTHQQDSFVIIVAIVLLSIAMDFVQELRATAAADRLRERVALRATALRDGKPCDIAAVDLVPGDVVRLQAGDLVPADARLLQSKDLFVNEALLSGESYPAEKHATGTAPAQREATALPADMILMGSSVLSGTASAMVVATGQGTQLGSIAGSLREPAPPTAFEHGLHRFGMLILRLTVLMVLFVLLVNLFFHRPLLQSFLFSMALAVGLTPELLPMIVSVTLARGAVRMARRQVIVKRLSAIHDLGSMDVLCSDKTGTLTQAHIKLVRQVDAQGRDCGDVLHWATINAAFDTGLKSPLDQAILEAGAHDLSDWKKIDEVPFDFERRRLSVLVEHQGQRYLIVKGAPEDILGLSDTWRSAESGSEEPLDADSRKAALASLRRLGDDGFRVLAVGWRKVEPERMHASIADERSLIFVGMVAFLDTPRESAREALRKLKRLGVSVKVITGDNEGVALHVCKALELTVKGVLTGPQLNELSDEALGARLTRTTLYCRITPAQKARIIRVLRARGHVVGYLGDGINDAPPLRAADVGLSVDGAADVAKEAAALILLQPDLGVVADAVQEGRRTFANIMKYVMMATSSNFGNMCSMAGAALILPFLPMLPAQILLNNLLYDVSELAIPLDHVDAKTMMRPLHWDMSFVRKCMLVLGSVSSLFDFMTFGLLLWIFHASQAQFQTAWFVESLITQALVIFIIRTPEALRRGRPHPALTASSLGVVLIAAALPYSPIGPWFGFVPVPMPIFASMLAITFAYLAVVDRVKRRLFRHIGRRVRG
ncbi:MAG: magnesium-translocating P-type ATPase [Bordetella sp.]|uniref:magnesium-translocating P-type ATPase n=1 Tax=Bordetella sp. TaxID=28081 RepID=UPI003F7B8BFE